jgi:hypothetical protein
MDGGASPIGGGGLALMTGRRARGTFRQSDIARAIKAVRAAGEEVARVEIDRDGKITIVTGDGLDKPEVASENSLDQWIAKHAR